MIFPTLLGKRFFQLWTRVTLDISAFELTGLRNEDAARLRSCMSIRRHLTFKHLQGEIS